MGSLRKSPRALIVAFLTVSFCYGSTALAQESGPKEGTHTFDFTLRNTFRIEDLEAQVRVDPNSADARMKLADAYRNLGLIDEAFAAYAEAIRISPGSAAAYFELGRIHDRRGRYSEAREAYRQAVTLNYVFDSAGKQISTLPEHAHILLAQFYYRRGLHQEGVEALKQAASIYPDRDDIHIYLCQVYLEMGDKLLALCEYNALKDKKSEFAERLLWQIENKR